MLIKEDSVLIAVGGVALLMPSTLPAGMLIISVSVPLLIWHLAQKLEPQLAISEAESRGAPDPSSRTDGLTCFDD